MTRAALVATGPPPVPANLAAERAVLGAALLDPRPEVLALDPRCFHAEKHRRILAAMRAVAGRGDAVDSITVPAELERAGAREEAGGSAHLALLVEEAAVSIHTTDYITELRTLAARRAVLRRSRALAVAAQRDGADLGTLFSELEETAAEVTALASPKGRGAARLAFTALGDLLAEPMETTRWLVEGRLPTAGLSLLAGKPKAGKSTLARGLALAVARGEPFLGWATIRGPVFYLALEEKRAEVRAHFAAMGGTDEDVRVFVARAPHDGLAQLRAAATNAKPALIIIDPLLRLVRLKNSNDYAEVTAALELLLSLARDTGAHVLAVHHLGKGERSGGDAILGSTAILAAVDTALLLRRMDCYRTLASIQRYGEDLEEITLSLDPVSRVVTAGPSRRDAEETDAERAIVGYLRAQGEPVEEPAIHDAVEGRKAVKERALRRLVAERRVTRTGAGRKGDPYRYADSPFLPPATPGEGAEGESETARIPATVALDSPSGGLGRENGSAGSREGASATPRPAAREALEL